MPFWQPLREPCQVDGGWLRYANRAPSLGRPLRGLGRFQGGRPDGRNDGLAGVGDRSELDPGAVKAEPRAWRGGMVRGTMPRAQDGSTGRVGAMGRDMARRRWDRRGRTTQGQA
ncbi:hypothetical protein GUJ93_ZPchr0001g32199 [Zizania palustris]|uniref:Uncharacterized protein n=1 Tax=Zizania palustris TaxID=103762 RepID=A0A8J5VLY4_ZIZPA|nr:hypothetical protein GUJ93_ZPchr0001g32199 [Zizania palustris]